MKSENFITMRTTKNISLEWIEVSGDYILEAKISGVVDEFSAASGFAQAIETAPTRKLCKLLYQNPTETMLLSDHTIMSVLVDLDRKNYEQFVMASITDGTLFEEQRDFTIEISKFMNLDVSVKDFVEREKAISWLRSF